MDLGLAVPVFNPGDDPIACLNKAMDFLTAIASSRFPSTNNQLRTSSNLRNQATIQDGRVTMQQVQGRQILDEEQLAFLADPGIPDSQAIHTTIPNTAAFQTEDLDAYDSDYDDVSNEKASRYRTVYQESVRFCTREKMIDSQMDDMIKEKLALKQQIDSLEQNLSNQIKEKESLFKSFVPQQELSDEQAFWLQTSHSNTDRSASSPVKIEAPRELLTTLKDIFNVFDKDLLNEITEVQTVFNQMKAVVQQYFVDKKCFEIQKKEFFLKNDRLLQNIMSQDVMICVMNSTAVFDDVNVEMQSSEPSVKCVDLDTELLNKQSAYNDLSKCYSQLEKHCISLELTMQLNQEIFQKD
ncbi:hypothetical protein Tco_1230573 [Tanacetum coccineum]